MATFDQRGQHVQYQYNAAGNINFGDIHNRADFATELDKLRQEVAAAAQSQVVDPNSEADADYHLKKAVLEARAEQPDKKGLLAHLRDAKGAIEGVTAVAGLAEALGKAIETAQGLPF